MTTLEASEDPTRLFIVLNPVAGNVHLEPVETVLNKKFTAPDFEWDIYLTTGTEDMVAVVQQAVDNNYSMVVAVGGDGTVAEVGEGLVHSQVPLGIVPLGTANLMARELGIPLAIEDACQLLIDHHRLAHIDALQVGDRVLVLHLGMGVYPRIISRARIEDKRRFGLAAYLWNIWQEIRGRWPRTWKIALNVDGQPYRFRASLVLITNVGVTGLGDTRWSDNIRPDDGQIDICIIRARTPLDYLALLGSILRQQQPDLPQVTCLAAKEEIRVIINKPIPIRLLDQRIDQTSIQVKVIPHALKVIVPKEGIS